MRLKELTPVKIKQEYIAEMEEAIIELFRSEIYAPLVSAAFGSKKDLKVENAKGDDELIKAIRSGDVRYFAGSFKGKFGSKVSRRLHELGAKWDRRAQGFRISEVRLDTVTKREVRLAEERMAKLAKSITDKVKSLSPEKIAGKLKPSKRIRSTMAQVNKDFIKSVKSLKVEAKFTAKEKKEIADKYTQSMEKEIKGWLDEEVGELRKRMTSHTLEGSRYEDIIKTIRKRYGVSQSKAKFLASQETRLMVSEIRQVRFKSAGLPKYKWRAVIGSPNHPVRDIHKKLNNTIHRWDNPPTTSEDGRKNHPGEDFNCRCIAIPVVEF